MGRTSRSIPACYLSDLDGLELGSNIKIGEMCFIGAAGGVVIEDDVSLAHATTVLTEEHDYTKAGPLRETPLVFAEVTIRRGVWIGAGVRITAGTEIGEESVVGAGAVVTRDVPPFSVAAGVPARVLRSPAWERYRVRVLSSTPTRINTPARSA